MTNKPYRPDVNRKHPPIDDNVRLPNQVRRSAAMADALVTGQPLPAEQKRPVSHAKNALTDAEIEKALRHLDCGNIKIAGP